MQPEHKGAVLLLVAAAAVLALVVAAWIYAAARPGGGAPEGGCGLLVVSAGLVAGFVAGAIWLVRSADDG